MSYRHETGAEQVIFLDVSPGGVIQYFDLSTSNVSPASFREAVAQLPSPSDVKTDDVSKLAVWPRLGATALCTIEELLGDQVHIAPTFNALQVLRNDNSLNAA